MPFEIYIASLRGHIVNWVADENSGRYNLDDYKKLNSINGVMKTETRSNGKVVTVEKEIKMDRYKDKEKRRLLYVVVPDDTAEESRSIPSDKDRVRTGTVMESRSSHSGGGRTWSRTFYKNTTTTEWGRKKHFVSFNINIGDLNIGKNYIVDRNREGDVGTKDRSRSRGDGSEEEYGCLNGDEEGYHRRHRRRRRRRRIDSQDNRPTSRDPRERARSLSRESSPRSGSENGRLKNGKSTERTSREKWRHHTDDSSDDSESEHSSSEAESSICSGTEVAKNHSVVRYGPREGSVQGIVSEVSTEIEAPPGSSQRQLLWKGPPAESPVKEHESRNSSERGTSSRGSLDQSKPPSKTPSRGGTGSVTSAQRTHSSKTQSMEGTESVTYAQRTHSSSAQSTTKAPRSSVQPGVLSHIPLPLTKANLNLVREGDSESDLSSTGRPSSLYQGGTSSDEYVESVKPQKKKRSHHDGRPKWGL